MPFIICRKLSILTENEINEDLIQRICGILDVNTFEVRPPDQQNAIIKNPEVECLRGINKFG